MISALKREAEISGKSPSLELAIRWEELKALNKGSQNTFSVDIPLNSGSGGGVHFRRIVCEVVAWFAGRQQGMPLEGDVRIGTTFGAEREVLGQMILTCLKFIRTLRSTMFTFPFVILPGPGDLIISWAYDATGCAVCASHGIIEEESA